MNYQANLVLILLNLVVISFGADVFDVTDFGADLKGHTSSTDAIRKAIEAAFNQSGGTVHFPKGQYLTGPIHLKSNITLDFAEGSVVTFSNKFEDYLPMITVRYEGTFLNTFSPLIYANKAENIVIRGKGVLDGQGGKWWTHWATLQKTYNRNGSRPDHLQDEFLRVNDLKQIASETLDMSRIGVAFLRPPFIQLIETNNLVIEDITLKNSPFWNINPVMCKNVTIRGVKVTAPYPGSTNTDGTDVDSCIDVLIENVDYDVGDDCIAIKSGRDKQGRRINRPTENVLIRNCHMHRGMGGVSIGSEQSAGVKNVTVKDCVFDGTDRGLYIKSTRGRGGAAQDIVFKNITMTGIKKEMIRIEMECCHGSTKPEPFSDRTPVFGNIKFEDITAEAEIAADMSGIPESLLEDIELKNIQITSRRGLSSNYTRHLVIDDIKQITKH